MEQVFVVRRRDFFGGDWPQGFVALDGDTGTAMLDAFRRQGQFVDRAAAEADPEWKQPIPYCAILRGREIFVVQRKRTQSETRLHDLLSIGLGGHVNPEADPPPDGASFFASTLRRELGEELQIAPSAPAPAFCGLLNDDSNPVGKVHVGLVYLLRLPVGATPPAEVGVREISKMAGGFRDLVESENLWQDPSRFESWSAILLVAGIFGPMAVSRTMPGSIAKADQARSGQARFGQG
jgi:predicted NUDIX family phosphoesterase